MADNNLINRIVNQGVSIYGSREKIRSQLIEYARQYLHMGDTDDIQKTSYLAYMIDMVSILSANHIFYDSTIYREFHMVDAQMAESVQNLAKWIGYPTPKATPSEVDVMFTFSLDFEINEINFNFPSDYKLFSNNIPFMIKSASPDEGYAMSFSFNAESYKKNPISKPSATGTILNNSLLLIRDYNGYNRPVYLSANRKYASFLLPCIQQEIMMYSKVIESDILSNQFYSIPLEYQGQICKLDVFVATPSYNQKFSTDSITLVDSSFDFSTPIKDTNGINCYFKKWTEAVNGVYTMTTGSEEYVWVGDFDKGTINFGNGIVGKMPSSSSLIVVRAYITKGIDGHVISGSINKGDVIYANVGSFPIPIQYSCKNINAASGGVDLLTLPELKSNAISNLSSKGRLVSDVDYDEINTIMGNDFPNAECYPVLKRSDIKINEIMAFIKLMYNTNGEEQIVPTRNVTLDVENPTFTSAGKYTVPRNTATRVGSDTYYTVFNMVVDKETRQASYDYILQSANGCPVKMNDRTVKSNIKKSCYIVGNGCNFQIDLNNINIITPTYPLYVTLNVNHTPNQTNNYISSDGTQNGTTIDVEDVVYVYASDGSTIRKGFSIVDFSTKMVTKWGDFTVYDSTSEYGYDVSTTMNESDGTVTYKSFSWRIDDYTTVPDGLQRFEFQLFAKSPERNESGYLINTDGVVIADEKDKPFSNEYYTSHGIVNTTINIVDTYIDSYYCDIIIRRDMSNSMQSSIVVDRKVNGVPRDWDVYHIYNVPTIESNYYNNVTSSESNVDVGNFELTTLQKLVSNLSLSTKRMMTDFINVKFIDSYGPITNLQFNPASYMIESRYNTPWLQEDISLMDITVNSDYVAPAADDYNIYYIVNAPISGVIDDTIGSYFGYIAYRIPIKQSDNTYTYKYQLIKPSYGMYVKIKDELSIDGYVKTCAWNGKTWSDVNGYTIPLNVKMQVEINSTAATSDIKVKQDIINAMSSYFKTKMGIQKELDRSELISIIRSVTGVTYAELSYPDIDIRFDYDIKQLTQEQLLRYTPQYIGFRGVSDALNYDNTSIEISIIRK